MSAFVYAIMLVLLFLRPLADSFADMTSEQTYGAFIILPMAVLGLGSIMLNKRWRALLQPPASYLLFIWAYFLVGNFSQVLQNPRNVVILISMYLIVAYFQENLREPRRLNLLFGTILLSSIIPAVVGLQQFFAGGFFSGVGLTEKERINSIFLSGEDEGAYIFGVYSYLSLCCCLLYFFLTRHQSQKKKISLILLSVLLAISIFLSGYRGSYLAMFNFSLIFIFLARKVVLQDKRYVVYIGVTICLIGLLIFSWEGSRERFLEILSPDYYTTISPESSIAMRVFNWSAVVDQLDSTPFFGHGLGSFQEDVITGVKDAGSMYTLTLYEGGKPLLLGIIFMMALQICQLRKRLISAVNQDDLLFAAFGLALVLTGIVLSLTETIWFDTTNGLRYWLALAVSYHAGVLGLQYGSDPAYDREPSGLASRSAADEGKLFSH